MALEFRAICQIQLRLSMNGQKPCAGKGYEMPASKTVIGLARNRDGDMTLSLSTAKALNGRRFLLKHVDQIVAHFVHEGKITLQMATPYIDLMIREASPLELGALMNAIQKECFAQDQKKATRGRPSTAAAAERQTATNSGKVRTANKGDSIPALMGKETDALVGQRTRKRSRMDFGQDKIESSGSERSSKPKQIRLDFTQPKKTESDEARIKRLLRCPNNPSTILKVFEKEMYPKGSQLSPSLLHIESTGIGLRRIDSRALSLQHLQFLNLTNNSISSVEHLKSLKSRLVHLVLDENPLGTISNDLFLAPALSSLSILSLKNTQLKVVPRSIVKLQKLSRLFLSENALEILPYNMHFLISLRYLDLNDNKLTCLPYPLCALRLVKLDISNNKFVDPKPFLKEAVRKIGKGSFPTLLELAAETIKTHDRSMRDKVILTNPKDVPASLYNFLEELKGCAGCNRMLARYRLVNGETNLRSSAEYLTSDVSTMILVKKVMCQRC